MRPKHGCIENNKRFSSKISQSFMWKNTVNRGGGGGEEEEGRGEGMMRPMVSEQLRHFEDLSPKRTKLVIASQLGV